MSEILFIVLNCGFLCLAPEEADSLHTQISNLVRRWSHEDPDYLLMKILDNLVQYWNVSTPSEIMSEYFSGWEPKNAKEEAISPDSHYQMSQPEASTHTSEFCICQLPIAIANDPRIVLPNMFSPLKTPKMEEFGLYHKQEAQLMENALERIFMKRRVGNAKFGIKEEQVLVAANKSCESPQEFKPINEVAMNLSTTSPQTLSPKEPTPSIQRASSSPEPTLKRKLRSWTRKARKQPIFHLSYNNPTDLPLKEAQQKEEQQKPKQRRFTKKQEAKEEEEYKPVTRRRKAAVASRRMKSAETKTFAVERSKYKEQNKSPFRTSMESHPERWNDGKLKRDPAQIEVHEPIVHEYLNRKVVWCHCKGEAIFDDELIIVSYKCKPIPHFYHYQCLKDKVTYAMRHGVNPTKCYAERCKMYLDRLTVRNIIDEEYVPVHSIIQWNQSQYQTCRLYFCPECEVIKKGPKETKTDRHPSREWDERGCSSTMYNTLELMKVYTYTKSKTELSAEVIKLPELLERETKEGDKKMLQKYAVRAYHVAKKDFRKCVNCSRWIKSERFNHKKFCKWEDPKPDIMNENLIKLTPQEVINPLRKRNVSTKPSKRSAKSNL